MTEPAKSQAELAGCTCFRLRRTARRMTQVYDAHLAPAGVTLAQYSLLANLIRGAPPSMQELAERMGMERTTLTRNLRPLMERRLVDVTRGMDRRSKRIVVTDEGRILWGEAKALWRAAQDDIQRRLGGAQVGELHRLLDHSFDRLAEPSSESSLR